MRRLGLAPKGACTATGIAAMCGALLPHLFTLAITNTARNGGIFSVALSMPCGYCRTAPVHATPQAISPEG